MDWSKAKSWLIVLFAALNIFLIVMLVSAMKHSSTIDKSIVLNTAEIMNNNNIKVSAAQIPDKIPKLNSVEVANAVGVKEEFAELIFKDTPIRKSANRYESGSKSIVFEQSKFKYENAEPSDFEYEITQKNAVSAATVFLNMAKIGTNGANYELTQTNGVFTVKFSQKLDKYPLFDSYVVVTLSNKGVLSAEGIWFFAASDQDNVKSAASRVKPSTGAAIDFISNEERIKNGSDEIEEITIGYAIGETDEFRSSATAVPVWQFKTTDGHIYYFDAH